jgi:F0F1-type ATP synthase membrane subunit b/b'
MVQIELWALISGIAAVVVAFGGMIWAFGKVLMSQFEKRLDERFDAIEAARTAAGSALKSELEQLKNVERDFLKFQVDLPLQYVRREDYIRGQSVLEAKQDALFRMMELVRIEIAQVKGVGK